MRFIKRLSTTFYADEGISFLDLRFENDVKMYGTQATPHNLLGRLLFENDVKMYGTQAERAIVFGEQTFENDVKMYGTQALRSANVRTI